MSYSRPSRSRSSPDPPSQTHRISVVLLGRALSLLSDCFLHLADDEFHAFLRISIFSLLLRLDFSHHTRAYITIIIANLANFYCQHGLWPQLGIDLFSLACHTDISISAVALDCLSECLKNQSLSKDDIGSQLVDLLPQKLIDGCPNLVLVASLRLLYSSGLAFDTSPQLIPLLQQLDVDSFQIALSDLARYFSEEPRFIGPQNVPSYLSFLMSVAAMDTLPDGPRICAIDLITSLITFYAECVTDGISELIVFFFALMCRSQLDDIVGEAADALGIISETLGGTRAFIDTCEAIFFEHGRDDITVVR
jgi:hypothetical protein